MTEQDVRQLLDQLVAGAVDVEGALAQLKQGPFQLDDLDFATLDHHRSFRQGLGEVVFGEGKTTQQILTIAERLATSEKPVLFTRLKPEPLSLLRMEFPQGRANEKGGTFLIHAPAPKSAEHGEPFVAVVSGGTSDFRVVEEAAEVCVAMDVAFERIYDVGVAGLHRLLRHLPRLQEATALVVVAGMEGALPSVVAGLVGRPVFAVPTSVGYGANLGGMAALLAMLNSCAPGVTVANIDNGFSAAFAACNVVRAVKAGR